jgi:hypothetical protein
MQLTLEPRLRFALFSTPNGYALVYGSVLDRLVFPVVAQGSNSPTKSSTTSGRKHNRPKIYSPVNALKS